MSKKSPTAIGALRRRITLTMPIRTVDDAGGAIETWQPYAQVWAAIVALSGRETDANDRRHGVVSHAITMRHRIDVKPLHRITCDGRTFHIDAIIEPDVKLRRLVCLVSERDL